MFGHNKKGPLTVDIKDLLNQGGKAVSFDGVQPGYRVGGKVLARKTVQARKYDPKNPGEGELDFWPNGDPKWKIVVTVQTAERNDSDDDGKRDLHINWWGQKRDALTEVFTALGISDIPLDSDFYATYLGEGPKSDRGGFPPKHFKYELVLPGGIGALPGVPAAAPTPPVGNQPFTGTPTTYQYPPVQSATIPAAPAAAVPAPPAPVPAPPSAAIPPPPAPQPDPAKLRQLVDRIQLFKAAGWQVADIRTQDEFAELAGMDAFWAKLASE